MNLKFSILSWLTGILFSMIGIINILAGNDPFFGLFILSCSLIYYPPFSNLFTKITGFQIPGFLKIFLALFLLWASVGVGELLNKIELLVENIIK